MFYLVVEKGADNSQVQNMSETIRIIKKQSAKS